MMYLCILGIADCDYNGHLSNSCFAQNSDITRFKFSVVAFAGFMLEKNCWAPLGGSSTLSLLVMYSSIKLTNDNFKPPIFYSFAKFQRGKSMKFA
jgi:hypothetical protein